MNQNDSYLKTGTQTAFQELESLVTSGYGNYIRIQRAELNIRNQGQKASDWQVKEWDSSYGTWVGETATKLQDIFYSANYSNEFMTANNGGGLRVTTGPYSTLMQNHLGSIRKLEEFRNRIFDHGGAKITVEGNIVFNVERDLNNAPGGTIETNDEN